MFTAKANFHAAPEAQEVPWNQIPASTATTTDHGRRITRTIKVADVPDWIDFPAKLKPPDSAAPSPIKEPKPSRSSI